MAATGAVALYHVEGITPEALNVPFEFYGLEVIAVESDEIEALFKVLPVDAVAVGCPHCSPAELDTIAGLLDGRSLQNPCMFLLHRVSLT